MPDRAAETPRSNELFFQIVAAVALARDGGLSVERIGHELEVDPTVVAQCIGLHVHLGGRNAHPVPLPTDYWIPGLHDVITPAHLEPPAT